MTKNRAWGKYPSTYRQKEVQLLADWVLNGVSGSVAGIAGSGKSNFLGFICHSPERFQPLLTPYQVQATLVPIDLNNLPENSMATFYRLILRSFYEMEAYLPASLRPLVVQTYQDHKAVQDPFLVQSALRELLRQFQLEGHRLLFVFDRFDDFCEQAPLPLTAVLRGLRDSFKDTLFYALGMRQEAAYLSDPVALGELYEVVDTRVCWIGRLSHSDARFLIEHDLRLLTDILTEEDIEQFLRLSGRFAALLKAICRWWAIQGRSSPTEKWADALLANPTILYRLQEILSGLSQEELLLVSEISRVAGQKPKLDSSQQKLLARLCMKGICQEDGGTTAVASQLVALHLANRGGYGRGRLWWNEQTKEIYQGNTPIRGLTPLEQTILRFLVQNPRIRLTKTDLIAHTWPEDLSQTAVTDDSLYQVIAGLRRKIEPLPARPCYLVNWRGKPEGGYQLFPEGRPT